MTKKEIATGVVHKVPADLRKILTSMPTILTVWEDITPLARNEWICWIKTNKKSETRDRRIKIMLDKFTLGKRRPCCWAGCVHR